MVNMKNYLFKNYLSIYFLKKNHISFMILEKNILMEIEMVLK